MHSNGGRVIGFLDMAQSVALLRLNRLFRMVECNALWSKCVEEGTSVGG